MQGFDPTGGYAHSFAGPETSRELKQPPPYRSRADVIADHIVWWKLKKHGDWPTAGELRMSTGMCIDTCKTHLRRYKKAVLNPPIQPNSCIAATQAQ